MTTRFKIATLSVLAALLILPVAADAQPGNTYEITITNLTANQVITPPVVVTHQVGVHLFVPGEELPEPMIPLVEDGLTGDLTAALMTISSVHDFAVADGPLMPGTSTTLEVQARGRAAYLSAVGMLATTNDAFFGLDGVFLLNRHWITHELAPAYDGGTEFNSESCEFIPGPPCENPEVRDTDEAEGFVHIHNGFHGVGDLLPEVWGWHNPVVRVDIRRLPRSPRR